MTHSRISHLSAIVPEDATLLEALRVINDGAAAVALVGAPHGPITGLVTDGDVRRALLAGHALDERCLPTVMRRQFHSVGPGSSRAEVLDLMRALSIEQVPVLDEQRHLVGLHLLHDLLGAADRPNAAVIMAGGRGVRLMPLTEHVPKPMIRVAGRPILERLVLHLVSYGIREIHLSVNYLAHMIEEHFADGGKFGCRISYLREERPLGTGGPLALLPPQREPLLVMNGDLVTQFGVDALLDFHERGGHVMTCGLRPYQVDVPFGVAEVEGGRIRQLREKPTHRMLVNAGIYVVSPQLLPRIPVGEEYPITRLIESALAAGESVGGHLIDDEWLDVGRHDELKRARGDV